MVKFKVHVFTPYEEFNRTYFARSEKRAKDIVNKWNDDFKGIEYSVKLISVEPTLEKIPEHYTVW